MKRITITLSLILFLLSVNILHAQHSDSSDKVQRVEIIVDSYSFKPDTITVEAGKPVEITLRSVASTISHDFTIDDPESGLSVVQEVRGGRDATFTFTPKKPGTYKFYCGKKNIFGSHEKKGMVGTLVVN
ncbi:MAG: cupredoxin domain-containing protein [Thermodesulfobacteriota bacterium]|jgi:plastocyanin|nr:cupredoxin domain-containing protein [Candidatus Dadabacteria bacterium]TDJ00417.1 MAG: quinol oxidase [Candidatus Dadabacteria bacterium]